MLNHTQQTRGLPGSRRRGGLGLRRLAISGAAMIAPACVLLAGHAVTLAAAGRQEPRRAASSPSDRPPTAQQPAPQEPAPQQPAAQQPAVSAAEAAPESGRVVYQSRRRRLRARAWYCVPQPSNPSRAAAAAQPDPQPDPYAWKSLFDGKTLNGWKSAEFGGEGKVTVENGMIVLDMGNDMTGVTYTGQPPRDNYELSLQGMRLDGSDFFCSTTFPVGKDPCTLVVGGWGGTVVGLSSVDYYDASDNPTTTFQSFKNNEWYRVRIRVTEAKIEAWIDDEQVVDQPRKGHKFGIRFEVDLCQPLGIATWCTKGAVRDVRIRQLPPGAAADELSKQ